MQDDEMNGKYWITTPDNRGSCYLLKDSERVIVDYGCLIVMDGDGEIIHAFAQGAWLKIEADSVMPKFMDIDD